MGENKLNTIEEAKREAPFNATELLTEIKPLIEDYFVGNFEMEDGRLVCKFLNGQTFCLTAEEIK